MKQSNNALQPTPLALRARSAAERGRWASEMRAGLIGLSLLATATCAESAEQQALVDESRPKVIEYLKSHSDANAPLPDLDWDHPTVQHFVSPKGRSFFLVLFPRLKSCGAGFALYEELPEVQATETVVKPVLYVYGLVPDAKEQVRCVGLQVGREARPSGWPCTSPISFSSCS